MKKIIVQEELTQRKKIVFCLTIFAIFSPFLFCLLFAKNFLGLLGAFILIAFICIGLLEFHQLEYNSNEPVSELCITETEFIIIYKYLQPKNIKLSEIEKFDVILNANNYYNVRTWSYDLRCMTVVNIKLSSGETVSFSELPSASFCSYGFILRLLNIADEIPNFSYKVLGNSKETVADVEHYAKHGKRLFFMKRVWIKNKIRILILLAILLLGFVIFH